MEDESPVEVLNLPTKPYSVLDAEKANPDMFKNMKSYNEAVANPNNCAVCLKDYERHVEVVILKCEHMFHRECMDKWLREATICPLCRKD